VTKYLRKQLKGGFIFAHGSRGFSPQSLGSVVSRPIVKQNIMVRSSWWSKAAHLLAERRKRSCY
jgi:hypothetical protein